MIRRTAAFVFGRRGEYRVLINKALVPHRQYERLQYMELCEFPNRTTARTIARAINDCIASIHRRA